MKIRISTLAGLNEKRRYVLTLAAVLCLISLTWAQDPAKQNLRRVTGLLVGQATEGSRVTVIADSTLDDYEAFRRGDRFYVKIPATEFTGMQPSFHGDGFDDVQVQKVGDSVVISFRLQPGASARVDGGSNRLEVTFFSPSRLAGVNNTNVNAIRSRVTRNSGRGGAYANSSAPKRGADVAGPMPPDSPSAYTPGNIDDGTSASNASLGTASTVRAANRREPAVAASTQSVVPSTSPNQTEPPYASSQYSSSYPPVTPAASPTIQTSTPTVAATNWRNRVQAAWQWVAVNKIAALIAGAALLALVGFMVFVLYQRRTARKVRLNTPRVQPKYSPDVELEDMLASQGSDASARVAPGPYVDEDAYEHWGDSLIGSEMPAERQGEAIYESTTWEDFGGTKDELWEIVGTPDPRVYQGRVKEEREVFEL